MIMSQHVFLSIFLSTLSLRRATPPVTRRARNLSNFYPRSPCGERPSRAQALSVTGSISIHALLAESDGRGHVARRHQKQSLSTLSLRRATIVGGDNIIYTIYISIHALLAESDKTWWQAKLPVPHFYPRSPCGERHNAGPLPTGCRDFYPRSPCGERPIRWMSTGSRDTISIHALLAESDPITYCPHMPHVVFLSTLSLRRATR